MAQLLLLPSTQKQLIMLGCRNDHPEDTLQEQLDITEIFSSIQGETSLSGLPTTFIRLARCNLRCSWCDTTFSFSRGTRHSLHQLLAAANAFGCPYVCVTGGEPLLQPAVHALMALLLDNGYLISLETGGSLPIDGVDARVRIILDIKCPASGMSEKNCWSNLQGLRSGDEVKFVLADQKDYEYAKEVCANYALFERPIELLFSPVHNVLDPQKLVQWILHDRLSVRLNLQIHKYIWEPMTRGV